MSAALLGVLVVVAVVAGIGITAVGPGGIALTAALYALTPLSPDQIAGTASATFVASGLLGSAAYHRSGELAGARRWNAAAILSVAGVAGVLVGVQANALLSVARFGALLGLITAVAGVSILLRERYGDARAAAEPGTPPAGPVGPAGPAASVSGLALAAVGAAIGTASAMLGVGGPVLAVPALVLLRVPMREAVAVAQVQSVAIALLATVGYARRGAVLWPTALLLGVPLLAGALVGWKVARAIDPSRLRLALAVVLIVVGIALPLLPRG